MIEFERTEGSFALHDPSGYQFTITTQRSGDSGWWAKVTVDTHGFNSEEAAIKHLVPAITRLLGILNEHIK